MLYSFPRPLHAYGSDDSNLAKPPSTEFFNKHFLKMFAEENKKKGKANGKRRRKRTRARTGNHE